MKKLLLIFLVGFSLSGCAQLQSVVGAIETTVGAATGSIANPVTRDDLYTFENTMIVAFAGLNAYKKACLRGAVDTNCKANIRAMQVYTRQIPPLLVQARTFVKNNDQVNARLVLDQAKQLYATFSSIAVANGVKVQ